MREDQTQLITARLEHLQFMMDSGKMPIFRQRSDMFLFALEAYNIARGLSSCYYRLQEDLDIRFFVRFRFDYWLQEIQGWIEQLGGAEYRVEDDGFFAEGRAKRLTIVVDRLFGYHCDRLPADSAEGSMALADEEILEPFRAIMQMKSTDLAASFRTALQEVYNYLFRLAMLPVEWPADSRRKALSVYLEDSRQSARVQTELTNYRYFCHMPGSQSVRSQFCYLRQRLYDLTSNGGLAQLSLSQSDEREQLRLLCGLFGSDESSPPENQIPSNARPMADDALFAKFLYFLRLDGQSTFPLIDDDKVSNYLIRKDVFLTVEQERSLQALFALTDAMRQYFGPVLDRRSKGSRLGRKMQQRADAVLAEVRACNGRLSSLLDHGQTTANLNAFFERLFSPELSEEYGDAQADLLTLLEKGHDSIRLEPYVHQLREAHNHLRVFARRPALGQEIYRCLEGAAIVQDANGDTVNSYFSKTGYKGDASWKRAIRLVEAVTKDEALNS